MVNTDFKHLEFLAKTEWGLPHLKELLYKPDLGLWRSSSSETCSDFYDAVKLRLQNDEQLINLLDLHLLTEALIYKDQAPHWFLFWVHEHVPVDGFLPEIPWPEPLCGHWHAAPVFLVHEETVFLRYFILGVISTSSETSLWPKWAERLMDESTKRGILSAVKACRNLHSAEENQSLMVYPLTMDNQKVQFREASLVQRIS